MFFSYRQFYFVQIFFAAFLSSYALIPTTTYAETPQSLVEKVYANIVDATKGNNAARGVIKSAVSKDLFKDFIHSYKGNATLRSCEPEILREETDDDWVVVYSNVTFVFRMANGADVTEVVKDRALLQQREDKTWEIIGINRPDTPRRNISETLSPVSVLIAFLDAIRKKDWDKLDAYIPLAGLNDAGRMGKLAAVRSKWESRDMRLYDAEYMSLPSYVGTNAIVTYTINNQIQDNAGNWIQPPDMKAVMMSENNYWKIIDIVPKDQEVKEEKVCLEKMCQGNTLLYDGFLEKSTGECKYFTFECAEGCDSDKAACIKKEQTLISVKFVAPKEKDGIILNGRHSIEVSGKAQFAQGGTLKQGQKFPMEGRLVRDGIEELPKTLGLRLFSAERIDGNTLKFKVVSESKMPLDYNLKGISLKAWPKGYPANSVIIPLVSPAPRFKIVKNIGKPEVWQESYGIFEVFAEDPDNNVDSYTIIAPYGTMRIHQELWEGRKKKILYPAMWDNKYHFNFEWMAPAISEHMQLDLVRDINEELKFAAKSMGEDLLDAAIEKGLKVGLGEGGNELYNKDALQAAAKGNMKGLSMHVLQYGVTKFDPTNISSVAKNVGDAAEQAGTTFAEVEMHTGEQAYKAGEAYEKQNEYYKEEIASRGLSILLDGFKLRDGFTEVAATALGKEKTLMQKLKDKAYGLTIGTMQKTLEYGADTYKAAGAQEITIPYYIYLIVTDEDGYIGVYKIVVKVSGYESLI